MVLAIGIVVDDAIVVVENVERHMREDRVSPKEAAKRAMNEVTAPVIAIVLVLVSVFVPVGFIGGITGALYKQFAATIAISVTVSGFVALTLSPARRHGVGAAAGSAEGWAWFDRFFGRTQRATPAAVAKLIVRPIRVMLVFGGVLLLAYGMFSAFPGASSRRIKATLSSWCSCRTALRNNGPTWCWSGLSDSSRKPGRPLDRRPLRAKFRLRHERTKCRDDVRAAASVG